MQRLNHDPNGASSASEFQINYVHIYTYRSELPVDITKLVNYVEIYESVYSPFMTLNVNITDTQSLNHLLPMIGEEFIELDIRGPDGETGLIKQAFYIYKLSDRMQAADKAFVYTLNCISSAAVVDMNLKISQAVSGQPSDIVKEKFARGSLAVTKDVYSHPSRDKISYISNYWTPLQNIRYLSERTVSKDTGAASYLFFETKKQFVFAPLDALVRQEANYTYFNLPNNHNTGIIEQQSIVHKLYVDETFNYINRIMDGAYGNRTLTVNPTRKSYTYNYYDFLESYDKFSRLNTQPFGTNDAPRRINSVFRVRTSPSSTIPGMPTDHADDWYKVRLTELAAMNSQFLNLDVSGRFNIYAGNTIELAVPVSVIPSETKSIKDVLDRTLSGRYLVTGIKHILTRERHTMSLQVSKDSIVNLKE